MKVYIAEVTYGMYEDSGTRILGVFSTREKAEKVLDQKETLIKEEIKKFDLAQEVLCGEISLEASGLEASEVQSACDSDAYFWGPCQFHVYECELDKEES